MKKLLLFSTIAFTTGMMACKVKGTAITFGESNSLTATTYTNTPDAPVGRKVLVEEFTGAKGTNCPDARVQLKTIADAHPGKVIVMELHPADHPPVSYTHLDVYKRQECTLRIYGCGYRSIGIIQHHLAEDIVRVEA